MHRVTGFLLVPLTLAYVGWKYADALGLRRRPVQPAPSSVEPAPPQLAEGPRLTYALPASDELWVGPDGLDADGYPLRHVDKVALVALVRAREFARAERFMERIQSEFEADYHKEDWALEVAFAFDSADPALAGLLDAWQVQSPETWQVHLARGMQLKAVAWARRGSKYLHKTSAA